LTIFSNPAKRQAVLRIATFLSTVYFIVVAQISLCDAWLPTSWLAIRLPLLAESLRRHGKTKSSELSKNTNLELLPLNLWS